MMITFWAPTEVVRPRRTVAGRARPQRADAREMIIPGTTGVEM